MGLLDAASQSLAGLLNDIPIITFITTEDIRISNDFRLDAQAASVAVWQIVVHESCQTPGELRNGPPICLNRNVYGGQPVVYTYPRNPVNF